MPMPCASMRANVSPRAKMTAPAQGLFWLNSPVASYYAGRFAERLLKMDKLNDSTRVEMAYLIAVGHPPADDLRDAISSGASVDESVRVRFGSMLGGLWLRVLQRLTAAAAAATEPDRRAVRSRANGC